MATTHSVTKAARRTTRRAARSVRTAGRAIARTAPPKLRAAWVIIRAVTVFLFIHAPRGFAIFVGGWARLIPSRFPIFTLIKGGASCVILFGIVVVLFVIGLQITVSVANVLGVYYSHIGTVGAVVAVVMWVAVWAVFGIIGRPATVQGPAALSRKQKAVAEVLRVTVPAVRADAKDAKDNQRPPMLDVGPLEPQDNAGGRSLGKTMRITLPPGALFDQVNPVAIAQALGESRDKITLQEGRHPGQVLVHVADMSPSERPPTPWPLAAAARFDITRPVPIGLTHDGATVTMNLFRVNEGRINGGSMLIGGTTDSGKTSFLRLLIAAAAKDPRTVIAVADFKGDDDYSGMAPALHWHRVRPTESNIDALGVMLGQVLAHMDAIKLGKAERVPILIVVDEAHAVLGNKGNKAVARQLEMVITQGRSFGVYVILAAQRPTAGAISTDLSANLRDRVCFRVGQQATGEVVVGAQPDDCNPYKFKVTDQGLVMAQLIGYEGKVQTFYVTGKDAERVAKAHPASGEWFAPVEAGFPVYSPTADNDVQDPDPDDQAATPEPSRQATISDPDPVYVETILHHIRSSWPDDGRDRMATAELAWRLAVIHTDYAGWGPADVTKALKPYGVEPGSIRIGTKIDDDGKERPIKARGVYLAQIERALGGVWPSTVDGVDGG